MDIKEKIKNPKLIIFDLDGTLVDSAEDITNALNHALIPYGFEPLAVEDTIKLVGEGLTRLVEKILGEKNAGIKDIVLERFIQYYSRHLTDFTRPYPGIKEVLQKLAKYKKAVISNKMESLSKTLLEQLGLLKFFDIVLGSDSTPEKKPSPAPVKKVVEIFKVNPVETVIVGDSDYDIQAGKRADVNTVAVTYGYRSKESLKDADFLIDNINQLLFVIGEETDVQERRKETRYVVPEIYRHYITFNIKDDTDAFINVSLLDFSRRPPAERASERRRNGSLGRRFAASQGRRAGNRGSHSLAH